MSKSLVWKLILAFLAVAVTSAVLVSLFIRVTSVDRLSQLIIDQQRSSLQSTLTDYYTQNGSWNGVTESWQQLRQRAIPTIFAQPRGGVVAGNPAVTSSTLEPGSVPVPGGAPRFFNGPSAARDRRSLFGLADANGVVIVSVDPTYPAGVSLTSDVLRAGTPVIVNGRQVGTILTARTIPRFNPEENLFLQRTNEALIFATIGAMIIALLIGTLLARTLIRPLQALTLASRNIAAGQLEQEVKVSSNDEIGQLAAAFNQMSQEVSRVNEQRRQMTADIAHDLRTPLTVIAGYVESMRDGVLQPTVERLDLIYAEIERLQNLVGDLKMLSQVDAGELPMHPRPIAPRALLERVAAPFQHHAEQAGVTLRVEAPEDLPEIRVDDDRMMQVFGNLINNALRYTPEGGQIVLKAGYAPTNNGGSGSRQVLLTVEDNGEGIVADELPYIFDRFHRADKSRHAEAGETGLGLAIVKALVEAQGGRVWAESKLDEGTSIQIALPPYKEAIRVANHTNVV